MELEMTGRTRISKVHQKAQGGHCESRTSVFSAKCQWTLYSRSRWKQRRKTLTGVHLETRYRGLAEDYEDSGDKKDETDTTTKMQHLNKKLLDHFRQLAASNQDTDQ
ncbi:hypothetical protein ILYODFUR_031102, partial [Ilyodon furcidens]